MTIAGLSELAADIALPIDDDAVGDAGRLVGSLGHRHAFDHVFIFDYAVDLGHDRAGVGIPLGQLGATFHLIAVVDEQACAVGHLVHRPLVAFGVLDRPRRCGP